MTTPLLITLESAGESLFDSTAATPGGGLLYVACRTQTDGQPVVARLQDDATIDWQVKLTLPGAETAGAVTVQTNGTHVAVLIGSSANLSYLLLLDATDGSIVWQILLDYYSTLSGGYNRQALAIDSASNVFCSGTVPSSFAPSDHRTAKFAAADGAVLWAKGLLDTGATSTSRCPHLTVTSTNDLAVSFEDDANSAAVFLLDGADGSLTWGRRIAWEVSADVGWIAVDPSDDSIYVIQPEGDYGASFSYLEVVKLDVSGAELWLKKIKFAGDNDYLSVQGGAAADASGVRFSISHFDDTPGDYGRMATVEVTSGGTTGSAASFVINTAYNNGAESLGGFGDDAYVTGYDTTGGDNFVVIGKTEGTPAAGSGTPYSANGVALVIVDSAGSTSSYTPTFPTDPTVTPTDPAGITDSTPTFTATAYTLTGGGGAVNQFGSVGAWTRSTTFGTPRYGNAYQASGFSSTQLGTPELDLNLEPEAFGFRSTHFGQATAFSFSPPGPRAFYPQGFRGTAFGSPAAALAGLYAQASTDPATRFGTPRARLRQPASSLGPTTQFGTVGAALRQRPAGFKATNVGTPSVTRIGYAQGFLSGGIGTPRAPGAAGASGGLPFGFTTTAFGTPKVRLRQAATSIAPATTFGDPATLRASGFKATQFGTPSAMRISQASGFLSGAFGIPRAPGAEFGRYFDSYSLGPTARFGTPRLVMRQQASSIDPATTFGTINAQHALGFKATNFGQPTAVRLAQAAGWRSGGFGTPRAPGSVLAGYFDAFGQAPSTRFGQPTVRLRQQATSIAPTTQFGSINAQHVQGFKATIFGTPTAVRIGVATGFRSGNFGTPKAPGAVLGAGGIADGFSSTAFGTPRLRLRQAAGTIAPTTTFGTPGLTVAQGWRATVFGTPTAVRVGVAAGFPATRFGTPRAPGAQFGRYYDLEGFSGTRIGTPTARLRQPATTIGAGTTFGAPAAVFKPVAAGFKVTQLGQPTVSLVQRAQGFLAGGVGTPRSPLPDAGIPFGFLATNFGTPMARIVRFNAAAAGFSGTTFGTPTAVQRHRARHLGPTTRFGTQSVARTCPV